MRGSANKERAVRSSVAPLDDAMRVLADARRGSVRVPPEHRSMSPPARHKEVPNLEQSATQGRGPVLRGLEGFLPEVSRPRREDAFGVQLPDGRQFKAPTDGAPVLAEGAARDMTIAAVSRAKREEPVATSVRDDCRTVLV